MERAVLESLNKANQHTSLLRAESPAYLVSFWGLLTRNYPGSLEDICDVSKTDANNIRMQKLRL